MKKILECPYVISEFNNHDNLKDIVLDLINNSKYDSPVSKIAEIDITKTDWNMAKDFSRKWLGPIINDLMEHMLELYKEMGYNTFNLTEIWFQQYLKNSEHGWHIHGGNFTNVYYLELPKETPKTQLISPFDQKTIIDLEIKEGSTLIFPSFTLHKAPKNMSEKRKTIISFNTEVGYPDETYGVGL